MLLYHSYFRGNYRQCGEELQGEEGDRQLIQMRKGNLVALLDKNRESIVALVRVDRNRKWIDLN